MAKRKDGFSINLVEYVPGKALLVGADSFDEAREIARNILSVARSGVEVCVVNLATGLVSFIERDSGDKDGV